MPQNLEELPTMGHVQYENNYQRGQSVKDLQNASYLQRRAALTRRESINDKINKIETR